MFRGKIMWDAPMQKRRTSDKNARLGKKIRTYRKIWWWDAMRWNQRHGIIGDENERSN